MNPRRRLRYIYDHFISLKAEPERIAMSMAIGVYVGVTPTIPFQTILIIICTFFLGQNFTTAYLGSWLVMNPVTIPFFYVAQYSLGKLLIGTNLPQIVFTDYSIYTIMKTGWCVGYPLLIGGFLMAPFFAIPAYFITYRAVIAIREKHKK
ncbi:MAG: DUF2062 domain-containing protein [Deltaproteobacteria bacterium]|nr:DUF2062 domain-containing protein [Deltaproteobacteria bacterium]MBN2688265.1 DUF2062 domain-containing protein [Deltaproteobacteria bacterium]